MSLQKGLSGFHQECSRRATCLGLKTREEARTTRWGKAAAPRERVPLLSPSCTDIPRGRVCLDARRDWLRAGAWVLQKSRQDPGTFPGEDV